MPNRKYATPEEAREANRRRNLERYYKKREQLLAERKAKYHEKKELEKLKSSTEVQIPDAELTRKLIELLQKKLAQESN